MGADERGAWRSVDGAPRRPPAVGPAHAQAPVFADLSGRRRRRMRRVGIGAAAALTSCLTVVAVGLLGGPRAPFVPWAPVTAGHDRTTARGAGPAGPAPSDPAPAPMLMPSLSPSPDLFPSPRPDPSPAPVSSSASPAATNPAGKIPPGRNHTKPPRPSPTARTHAA